MNTEFLGGMSEVPNIMRNNCIRFSINCSFEHHFVVWIAQSWFPLIIYVNCL